MYQTIKLNVKDHFNFISQSKIQCDRFIFSKYEPCIDTNYIFLCLPGKFRWSMLPGVSMITIMLHIYIMQKINNKTDFEAFCYKDANMVQIYTSFQSLLFRQIFFNLCILKKDNECLFV